jgi:hypothetical protein
VLGAKRQNNANAARMQALASIVTCPESWFPAAKDSQSDQETRNTRSTSEARLYTKLLL